MCGRFSLSGEIDFYADYFGATDIATESLSPSWNVAPTDPVYVVAQRGNEDRTQTRALRSMRWGLVPHWSPDPTGQSININARVETVATTAAFRDSFRRKRCLIPADGFYEWESDGATRRPHWIARADGYPVGFAGIWATRREGENWTRSCAIITAAAGGVISTLHDRMPVALAPEVWEGWLDRGLTDPELALSLLQPIASDLWMEREVSSKVNSVRNNGPDLLEPPDQLRLL
ncbi:MAG TPA: SOS response-associated peptidase [Acidimicrobiia bacterium]